MRWKPNKEKHYKKAVSRLSHRGKPLGYVARHHDERRWRAGVCALAPGYPSGAALGTFRRRCDAKRAVEAAVSDDHARVRDRRLGALEPPGSYGLCWKDVPGGRKCERKPHGGPCLRPLVVGAPVRWRGIDMTVAEFMGEQRGDRVVRSTWDGCLGGESTTVESELERRRRFEIRSVTPIGQRESEAFVSRRGGSGGLERIVLNVYPPEHRAERLREARTGIPKDAPRVSLSYDFENAQLVVEGERALEDRPVPRLSLREAADLVGVSVVEFSGLEAGHGYTLDDEAWERLIALIDGARLAKGEAR